MSDSRRKGARLRNDYENRKKENVKRKKTE